MDIVRVGVHNWMFIDCTLVFQVFATGAYGAIQEKPVKGLSLVSFTGFLYSALEKQHNMWI